MLKTFRKEDNHFLTLEEYDSVEKKNEQFFLKTHNSTQPLTPLLIGTRDPEKLFGLLNGERLSPEQLQKVNERNLNKKHISWYVEDGSNLRVYTYNQLKYNYLKIYINGEDYYLLPNDYPEIVRGKDNHVNDYYFKNTLIQAVTNPPSSVKKDTVKPVSYIFDPKPKRIKREPQIDTSAQSAAVFQTTFLLMTEVPQEARMTVSRNQSLDKASSSTRNYPRFTGHKRALVESQATITESAPILTYDARQKRLNRFDLLRKNAPTPFNVSPSSPVKLSNNSLTLFANVGNESDSNRRIFSKASHLTNLNSQLISESTGSLFSGDVKTTNRVNYKL